MLSSLWVAVFSPWDVRLRSPGTACGCTGTSCRWLSHPPMPSPFPPLDLRAHSSAGGLSNSPRDSAPWASGSARSSASLQPSPPSGRARRATCLPLGGCVLRGGGSCRVRQQWLVAGGGAGGGAASDAVWCAQRCDSERRMRWKPELWRRPWLRGGPVRGAALCAVANPPYGDQIGKASHTVEQNTRVAQPAPVHSRTQRDGTPSRQPCSVEMAVPPSPGGRNNALALRCWEVFRAPSSRSSLLFFSSLLLSPSTTITTPTTATN